MAIASSNSPLILSFVSGKGGVGKTMLAVSAANELAQSHSTLILDLDFFNRGLSGMFVGTGTHQTIPSPTFLRHNEPQEWFAVEISHNLFTISFPDIDYFDFKEHTPERITELAEDLKSWIVELSDRLDCTAVVLDCHGGPDALSFASTIISTKTLLVSEPDRVTMYGTLHFLRRLAPLGVNHSDIHLIFNKVVDTVRSNFLWRLYNESLRAEYFGGKPLLAAFPLELYLTKSFEMNPLVVEDYPHSMLAQKTKVMLSDLLSDNASNFLSERTESIPKWIKFIHRRFFWRSPRLLSLDFMAAVGFVLLLLSVGMSWLDNEFRDRLIDYGMNPFTYEWSEDVKPQAHIKWEAEELRDRKELLKTVKSYLTKLIMIWATFAAMALLLSWTRYLDRQAIFFSQKNRYIAATVYLLTTVCLWGLVIYFLSTTFNNLHDRITRTSDGDQLFVAILGLVAILIVVFFWLAQAYRAYREIKYSNRLFVGAGRGFCALLVVITPSFYVLW